jgi:hypothetical protein
MAGKISVKTAIFFSFLYGVGLILCACMVPVNVSLFLEDERVQQIIESSRARVKIHEDSDDFDTLVAENGAISGLDSGKYYLVEKEENTEGNPVSGYPKYVSDLPGPGRLSDHLGGITTVSEGKINRLTNFHTYTVRTAQPFPDDTEFEYTDDSGTQSITVTDGAIVIPAPDGIAALDLTKELIPGTTYEIMAVAVGSSEIKNWIDLWGENQSIWTDPWDILPLEGEGTIVDYVIIELDSSGDPVIPVNFKVLRVKIEERGVNFTVTFDNPEQAVISGGSPVISWSAIEGGGNVTITLGAPAGGGSWVSYEWQVAGIDLTGYNDNDLVINDTFLDVLFKGEYLDIDVVADDGDKLWSDTIRIDIIP